MEGVRGSRVRVWKRFEEWERVRDAKNEVKKAWKDFMEAREA